MCLRRALCVFVFFFFFKQKTAYEMRISDWSSDVCSSDLDRWATAPNPGPRGTGSAVPGGSSLVVFAGHDADERAWDVVAGLLAPAAQLQFHRLTGDLPARRSVWRAAGLAADPLVAPFAAQLDHATALPKIPEWERIMTEMQIVAERMVRGDRKSTRLNSR